MSVDEESLYKGEMRLAVEEIQIQEGWIDLDRGYFCLVKRGGLCVEDFGSSRRQALRRARRAWRKEKDAEARRETGYPRVQNCD